MYKNFLFVSLLWIFYSCSEVSTREFTIRGELTSAPNTLVYLELIAFDNTPPQIIDSITMRGGKFELKGKTGEESLLQIRFPQVEKSPLFFLVNDKNNIEFQGDWLKARSGQYQNSPASERLRIFVDSLTAMQMDLMAYDTLSPALTDSLAQAREIQITQKLKAFKDYTTKTASTESSPVISLFAASINTGAGTQEENEKLYNGLQKRFPKHAGVALVVTQYREMVTNKQQESSTKPIQTGKPAPEITLPDTEGKIFKLSSLQGKYVLIDFWASWCGPCRDENPNVVAAYLRFKDKNFTVLGVSLDKNKADWLKAIQEDKLIWQHVSDLKFWETPMVQLYGFDGIPYNVLIDPQGIVIADNLRGDALIKKLEQVLKGHVKK
jgi:peroxiredoxin